MTADSRSETLAALAEAWDFHPDWGIGRLVHSAAAIVRGQIQVHIPGVSDAEIEGGLKALIPSEWELEKDKGKKR